MFYIYIFVVQYCFERANKLDDTLQVLGLEETVARINDMLVRSKVELGIPETVPYDIVVSMILMIYIINTAVTLG